MLRTQLSHIDCLRILVGVGGTNPYSTFRGTMLKSMLLGYRSRPEKNTIYQPKLNGNTRRGQVPTVHSVSVLMHRSSAIMPTMPIRAPNTAGGTPAALMASLNKPPK